LNSTFAELDFKQVDEQDNNCALCSVHRPIKLNKLNFYLLYIGKTVCFSTSNTHGLNVVFLFYGFMVPAVPIFMVLV